MAKTRRPAMRYNKLFDEGLARKYARRIESGRYKDYGRMMVYQPFADQFKDPIAYLTPEEAELERAARVRHEDELRRPRMAARDPSTRTVSLEDRAAALRRVATTPVNPAATAARGYMSTVFDSDADMLERVASGVAALGIAGVETAATMGGAGGRSYSYGRATPVVQPARAPVTYQRAQPDYRLFPWAPLMQARPAISVTRPGAPAKAVAREPTPVATPIRVPEGMLGTRLNTRPLELSDPLLTGVPVERSVPLSAYSRPPVPPVSSGPAALEPDVSPSQGQPDRVAEAFGSLGLGDSLDEETRGYYDRLQTEARAVKGRELDAQTAVLHTMWQTGRMNRDDVYRRAVQLRLDRDKAPATAASVDTWTNLADYRSRMALLRPRVVVR